MEKKAEKETNSKHTQFEIESTDDLQQTPHHPLSLFMLTQFTFAQNSDVFPKFTFEENVFKNKTI